MDARQFLHGDGTRNTVWEVPVSGSGRFLKRRLRAATRNGGGVVLEFGRSEEAGVEGSGVFTDCAASRRSRPLIARKDCGTPGGDLWLR